MTTYSKEVSLVRILTVLLLQRLSWEQQQNFVKYELPLSNFYIPSWHSCYQGDTDELCH